MSLTPRIDDIEAKASPSSVIEVDTSSGLGNMIRRYSNTTKNTGTAITKDDDSTYGTRFTINEDGIYSITFSDSMGSGGVMGIARNGSHTSGMINVANADTLAMQDNPGGNETSSCSWCGPLEAGDVISPNCSGVAHGVANRCTFRIAQVVKL